MYASYGFCTIESFEVEDSELDRDFNCCFGFCCAQSCRDYPGVRSFAIDDLGKLVACRNEYVPCLVYLVINDINSDGEINNIDVSIVNKRLNQACS